MVSQLIDAIINYEFIRNALIAGLMLGFIAPLLGTFVVVRRMSFISDTYSHVALAGVSFAMFLTTVVSITINPLFISLLVVVITSVIIERIRNFYPNFKEIILPIALSASVALTVIFASKANGLGTELLGYLFGSINTITRTDLATTIALSTAVIIITISQFKPVLVLAFDEKSLKFTGKSQTFYRYLFTLLIGATVVLTLKIFGALLVSALLTIPVAGSIKISKSFKQTIIIAILFSELSVLTGFTLAYYLDFPSGATIVLINLAIYITVLLYDKYKSKLTSTYRKNISS